MTDANRLVGMPAALMVAPVVAHAQPAQGWGHMQGWGMMWGGGWMMLLFWIAVIAVAVMLFRRYGRASGLNRPDALDVLRERYARGEIDEAEFEARRRVLEKG
jgi:putative membrane protein